MSSRQKLQIVDVSEKSGTSARTGKPYLLRFAQCVVHQVDATGQEKCVVGTMLLPDKVKDAGRGEYLAEFELVQSREGDLVAQIYSLQAFAPPPKPVARASAA